MYGRLTKYPQEIYFSTYIYNAYIVYIPTCLNIFIQLVVVIAPEFLYTSLQIMVYLYISKKGSHRLATQTGLSATATATNVPESHTPYNSGMYVILMSFENHLHSEGSMLPVK